MSTVKGVWPRWFIIIYTSNNSAESQVWPSTYFATPNLVELTFLWATTHELGMPNLLVWANKFRIKKLAHDKVAWFFCYITYIDLFACLANLVSPPNKHLLNVKFLCLDGQKCMYTDSYWWTNDGTQRGQCDAHHTISWSTRWISPITIVCVCGFSFG